MEFFSIKQETFGLDISDSSLKIVKLQKSGEFFYLASFGKSRIEPGIIEQGEIKNEQALTGAIKKALQEVRGKPIKTKYVALSLPEQKAFSQVIQMPKMKKEELQTAIYFEAENYIPLPIEQVYLDSQIVPNGPSEKVMDVLIVAFPKTTVDSYLALLKKTGLLPKVFETNSLAICRALKEPSSAPLALIDLGDTQTDFIIFSRFSPRFTSTLPISGRGFTQIISKVLKISEPDAEKLKIKYGLEERIGVKIKDGLEKTKEQEIFEALIPILTDLKEQIVKCINYFQSHNPQEKSIEKILLSGGGANLKGLAEFLSKQIKIPVELGNPWVNILPKGKTPPLSPEDSLSYTTALGLALRGIKYD